MRLRIVVVIQGDKEYEGVLISNRMLNKCVKLLMKVVIGVDCFDNVRVNINITLSSCINSVFVFGLSHISQSLSLLNAC